MPFLNCIERTQHPEACLIPDPVWKELFLFECFPDELHSWMDCSDEELRKKLSRASDDEKQRAWIALAFSRPSLSNEELINLGGKFGLGVTDLLDLTSLLGSTPKYLALWDSLAQREPYSESLIKNYQVRIQRAAACGFLYILKSVLSVIEPEEPSSHPWLIEADDFEAFQCAARYAHLDIFNYLEEKSCSETLQDIIAVNDFIAFRVSAANGHLDILHYLEEKFSPETLQEMIGVRNYDAFIDAAASGHLDILRYLEEKTSPKILQDMIAAQNYDAFIGAAASGHLDILRYLEEKTSPKILQDMIAADNYQSFLSAAKNGHLDILRYLEKKSPSETLQQMIAADNFIVFISLVMDGHLDIIHYLEEKISPETLQQMIAARNFYAFIVAAEMGHLDILHYLEKKTSSETRQDVIAARNYDVFRYAAVRGHLNILHYLEEKSSSETLQQMIAVDDFYAFRHAAENGHLDTLHYLEEKSSSETLQQMIAEEDFYAFRFAAKNGHLDILHYLEEKSSPETLQQMIAEEDFYAFRHAAQNGHFDVTNHLLSHAAVFSYTEAHQYESQQSHVTPFIENKLTALRTSQQKMQAHYQDAVFDVTSTEEAKLLFYIARNLIRRNDAGLIEDLRYLLEIPSIKALAHTAITLNQPNELLRLALSLGNRDAATLLLNIPAVRELAQQYNFYQNEQQEGVDLREFAADTESSMTALTQGEQKRLHAAIERYEPLLKQAGAPAVLEDLRYTLESHYRANPAVLATENESIYLPLSWNDFVALSLTPMQREKALKAYYQNKPHTAWRYISKPNHWMHEDAGYVCINEERTERWSNFEEYQSLIGILYLAAIDELAPCIDGFTFATRLTHFIDELAHLGRAHNWDTSKLKNGVQEHYDDLEADRPSCFSGVKRRLFQSVLGHPLLKLLTEDIIKTEINEFLKAHFEKNIYPENRLALKQAWDKGIEGEELTQEDINLIKTLNVNEEQQLEFKRYLSNKYGSSFSEDSTLIVKVDEAFLVTPSASSHLFKHGGLMVDYFSRINEAEKPSEPAAQNPNRFFGPPCQHQNDRQPEFGSNVVNYPTH
ncbi:ankyrin repeat domain-containing protein [Legionella sainthelensi]|uniref:ankyrin repeat domain-containing protein n=1 Tax=Legionella sainthelensi TaxID=28087 RepID=UPI000E20038A|nr:ankyrin repeat domain-containing protein [Legionella sainthelensi]